MIVSELIKKLEEIKAMNGDIEVTVQFRDGGGKYIGEDELMFEVREDAIYTKQVVTKNGDTLEYRDEEFSGKRLVL